MRPSTWAHVFACNRGSPTFAKQIDFGVGDAVHPQPQVIEYPLLLTNSPIRLHAYPVEAAIAERFHAMVDLDLRNSRMKDFYDIWVLSRTLAFSGHGLSQAIRYTFERRQTSVPTVVPVALTAAFYSDSIHVRQWSAFLDAGGRGGGHIGGPSGSLGASRPMAVDVGERTFTQSGSQPNPKKLKSSCVSFV